MNALQKKIALVVVKAIFEHAVVPMATEYVNRTDNTWDNKALEFLMEIEKYCITKLQG